MSCEQSRYLVEFRYGDLSFLFDRQTLWLRRIRWREIEVVRAIYAAVRNRNWGTVPPKIVDLQINRRSDGVDITVVADCREGAIDFRYEGRIEANIDGTLQFDFHGVAQSDFLKNRIGLCVLHPITSCAGSRCKVKHTTGEWQDGSFPESIAPHQPFLDIKSLSYAADAQTDIGISFSGETFEMEDQRNWTDSSFKTYGTPLTLPFPARVQKGQQFNQTVALQFRSRISISAAPASARVIRKDLVLPTGLSHLHSKPAIGFGLRGKDGTLALRGSIRESLAALRPDHLRVDLQPSDTRWRDRLADAVELVRSIDAGLHVATYVEDSVSELPTIAELARELRAPVKLWLLNSHLHPCTPTALVRDAQEILKLTHKGVPIAAGTDANFAELNRNRPPADANWHSCFSLNPQVHASDDLSLLENIEAQAEVLKSAALFTKRSVIVSPITLLPRLHPDATDTALYDVRQKSMLGAVWALGSLAQMISARNLHSVTYFELAGPCGVMDAESGELYPMYYVFAELASLPEVAAVTLSAGGGPTVSAIFGSASDGRKLVLIGNHSLDNASVRFQSGPQQLRVSTLEQSDTTARWSAPQTLEGIAAMNLPPLAVIKAEFL